MTAAAGRPSRLKVLIADDHDLFARALRASLEATPDLEVVGRAANGAEAVALATALHPDVVLMDVSMPCRDGIVATREITKALAKTRVVVVSAARDAETAGRARSAGAAAYVFKGCPLDDLIAAVREVAPSPHLEAQAA